MRLIDADKLKVHHGVNVGANYGGLRAVVFKKDIDNAPTIDAVEVVRCRDCIHWFFCRDPLNMEPDDFCSDGIRRGKNE